MPQMYPVGGKRLFIGNATIADQDDAYDASDFEGQVWTEVKGWVTHGSVGGSASLVTSEQINSPYVKKAKGVKNSGSMENVFDILDGDAGQEALIAAVASKEAFAFKIEAPLREGQATPKTILIAAFAMGYTNQGGGPNDPDRFATTFEIQNAPVEVAAT